MENSFCFVCLKTCSSSFSTNGENEMYKDIFWKFAKDYLQISSSLVNHNGSVENSEIEVSSVEVGLSEQCLCENCNIVVKSICQLYLELRGVQLRLSWRLGELGKLLESESEWDTKVFQDSAAAEAEDKDNPKNHHVEAIICLVNHHVRNLLTTKCFQKAREFQPRTIIPPDVSSCDDHDHKKPIIFPSGTLIEDVIVKPDVDSIQEGHGKHFDAGVGKDDSDHVSCSGSDWCPSDIEENEEDSHAKAYSDTQNQTSSTDSDSDWSMKNTVTVKSLKRKRKPTSNFSKVKKIDKVLKEEGPIPSWDCEVCGPTTALRVSHLQKHEQAITEKVFQCWFCYEAFSLQQSLDHHVGARHSEMVSKEGHFLCQVDGCQTDPNSNQNQSQQQFQFKTISQLNDHLKTHHLNLNPSSSSSSEEETKTIHLCATCGLGVLDLNLLNLHELLHIKPMAKERRKRIRCPICEKVIFFSLPTSLQSHYNYYHGKKLKTVKCSECGLPCASKHALNFHNKKFHNNKDNGNGRRRKFPIEEAAADDDQNTKWCSECGPATVFKNQSRLDHHISRVHKPVSCEICGENVIGLGALWEHKIKVHKFNDSLKCEVSCPICTKVFSTRLAMQQHKSRAHPKSKVSCDICGRLFNRKGDLKEHKLKSHVDEDGDDANVHICPHCPNTFLTKTSLTAHLTVVHPELTTTEGYRVHDCPNCPEKFRRRFALHRHIIKEHPEGKIAEGMLECHVCKFRMPIGRKAYMDRHILTHMTMEERRSAGKLYICYVCGKELKTMRAYKKHTKRHENDKLTATAITSTS